MVDIQSPTAEIRRGKKEERKKEETTGQKYNVRICYAGRPSERRKTTRVSRCQKRTSRFYGARED